ncbi:MAG TPA: PD-(D/E)XK nuclease family protein [Pseudoduganella sp.]|jgi:CRISPR/Cas system-associated exonuclease Cas4 (RecB family)
MNAIYAFAIFVFCLFLFLIVRACRVARREERWLPAEIAAGKLMFSEQVFTGPGYMPVVARVDRIYMARAQLHLLELKVRRDVRVHETDVIELSAQRAAVQASTGMDVSLKGFVIIEHPDSHRRAVRKADLLTEEQVAWLIARRRAILDGIEQPIKANSKGRCARCEYRSECKGKAGFKVYAFVRPSSGGE